MAAMGVGGDPMDLPVDKFNTLWRAIPDIENWKNGESDQKRRHRVLMEKLEDLQ